MTNFVYADYSKIITAAYQKGRRRKGKGNAGISVETVKKARFYVKEILKDKNIASKYTKDRSYLWLIKILPMNMMNQLRTKPRYTIEQKSLAIYYVNVEKLSYNATAHLLGCHPSTIMYWCRLLK